MKPIFALLLLSGLALTLWTSCGREVEPPADIDYSYYPLREGSFVEYRVDSVLFSDFNLPPRDTAVWYLRQELRSPMTDGEGDTVYQVYRSYRRDTSLADWDLLRVWSVKRAEYRIETMEENMRFIRMVFPVREDKTWDGIVHLRTDTVIPYNDRTQETINLFKDWGDFKLINEGQPFSVNGLTFARTVTVLHVDKTNNIERRYSLEVYAADVGLIYKEIWILDTQCISFNPACINDPWPGKAERGFLLRQSVVRYGG